MRPIRQRQRDIGRRTTARRCRVTPSAPDPWHSAGSRMNAHTQYIPASNDLRPIRLFARTWVRSIGPVTPRPGEVVSLRHGMRTPPADVVIEVNNADEL